MELPSFDLLWRTSEQLDELESVLEQIDRVASHKKLRSRRRLHRRREGLYGVTFDIEDRDYYEPIKYCCDEAFYTEPEYNEHVANHQPCGVDGCPFVGYGRILRIHTEVVHSGGFYNQIYRETSDKGILEWRAARRRNYPTLERAAVKRELLAQRIARGQVFKTAEFGALKRNHPPILSERDLGSISPSSSPPSTAACQAEEALSTHTQFVSGSPEPKAELTTTLPHSSRLSPDPEKPESPLFPSLVAADYDSANTDTDDKAVDKQIAGNTGTLETVEHPNPPTKSSRGRRQRGGRRRTAKRSRTLAKAEDKSASADEGLLPPPPSEKDPFSSHPVVQMAMKRRIVSKNPNRIHSRPTLLHMLLADEMRTERNQLMQCVRYVVKHNCFLEREEDKMQAHDLGICDT
ncbi:hypothetical protein CRM22_011363 [Opisthorchis felineus]|uniref:FMR1-interacting protein 1 conserved domain-containing protein n=1 Tax=Opisthorchis felineus TaxID=147828 RepID=A0A4S2JLL7_OPIFE|nr:hypothetical protein CRM22_011363 [Opisthorchis felineus]